MTETFPCPYHKTSLKVCEHEDACPLMEWEEYVVCTSLTESDIARVVVAVEWKP